MSNTGTEQLYRLLPAIMRLRDSAKDLPLKALMAVIDDLRGAIETDIDGLYEDWFIETCAQWVIPYIGDLVGNHPLQYVTELQRADVAKTIYYRRRKGTLHVLSELAEDVTGWDAHAVEFFEMLGWTQYITNHQRYQMAENPVPSYPNAVDRVGTINLRRADIVDMLDGPFDRFTHTVDVRSINPLDGWYNIRNLGFFLWRLQNYPLVNVRARKSSLDHVYHFSILGAPSRLFNCPSPERETGKVTSETDVPDPIRPLAFEADLAEYNLTIASLPEPQWPENSRYYGPDRSICIFKAGNAIPPSAIVAMDLSDWASLPEPPVDKVAVDVRTGRFAFHSTQAPSGSRVTYNYGFSDDLGGGPYDRRKGLPQPDVDTEMITVNKGGDYPTLSDALDAWDTQGNPRCIIRILDSEVYSETLVIDMPADTWLTIEAANRERPAINPMVDPWQVTAPDGATLIVNGLLVGGGKGAMEIQGSLDLTIEHCTFVPGRRLDEENGDPLSANFSFRALPPAADEGYPAVTIRKSIMGPLRLPTDCRGLTITDSIVQAPVVGTDQMPAIAANASGDLVGPQTTLERCTIWGSVNVREITLATEVIFNGLLVAQRQQVGCVRFSYVLPEDDSQPPASSLTPRRYRCQPDQALHDYAIELGLDDASQLDPQEREDVLARVRPMYTSEHYGDYAYAQLHLFCAEEISTGAEDKSEMGVFSSLKQPQRLANLRVRLDEYMPFGLKPGFIYVT